MASGLKTGGFKAVSFNYQTELIFSSPACDHRFSLRILPQSDVRQRIQKLSWRIDPVPVEAVWRTVDGFGNQALSGHIDAPHGYFRFGIEGAAEVSDEPYTTSAASPDLAPGAVPDLTPGATLPDTAANSTSDAALLRTLLYPTELTQPDCGLADFSADVANSAPDAVLERIQFFSHAVHNCLRYERGATTNSTTAQEAFDLGAGVCQDYAHILVALLRLDKIPCRYVAGLASDYGETHAWVEAWTGNQYCGTDPTRDKLIDSGYIALSRGRDFADCSIERGVFKGACRGTQAITLTMEVS